MQNTRLAKLLDFLSKDPQDSFILYALATEYNAIGDLDNAFLYYQKLVTQHPDYVGTYYHFGKLLEKMDKKELAFEIYQKGIATARAKRNRQALSELQNAYNSFMGLNYEDD